MSKHPSHNVTPSTPSSVLSSSQPQTILTFTSAYSPKIKSQLFFAEQGRTKQSFKDECDINTIMRRYSVTGQLDHVNQRQAMYGEVPDYDFAQAMQTVQHARDQFAALPSDLRDRFGNDPARLLAFLQDPANRQEAVTLGLVNAPPPPPEPIPAEKAQ
ncbi:MAG: internal scaffolding protein [Microviridae sp.]|nr:MAG: internal scaffolding protein [Microviridae sp.]